MWVKHSVIIYDGKYYFEIYDFFLFQCFMIPSYGLTHFHSTPQTPNFVNKDNGILQCICYECPSEHIFFPWVTKLYIDSACSVILTSVLAESKGLTKTLRPSEAWGQWKMISHEWLKLLPIQLIKALTTKEHWYVNLYNIFERLGLKYYHNT